MTTVREALILAAAELTDRIPEPVRLDAEILLGHLLEIDRSALLARGDETLPPEQLDDFQSMVSERGLGRPIAHLIGEWEFYGLPLTMTPDVLVPRPDTETLVEVALRRLPAEGQAKVLDLCTGSGCVAIALAATRVEWSVVATDISPEALEVAERNVKRHGLSDRVELRQGDLFDSASERFDLIVSNPPYVVADDPALAADVAQFEPSLALFDALDGDGLGFYRRIASEAAPHLCEGGAVAVEVGETQAEAVSALFRGAGFQTSTTRDLAGIERVVLAE
ncbi:MAG: peptide chain release factor N(5)-glutamine methyltransferase [Planctomycetota bacterium]